MVTIGSTTQTFQFFTYTSVGVLNSKRTAALLLRHYRTVQRKYIFPFFHDVIIYARRMSQHTDDPTNVWHVVLMSMAESLLLKQLPFPQT